MECGPALILFPVPAEARGVPDSRSAEALRALWEGRVGS